MKAVILAAGRGTRFGALTCKIPKPLIKVAGRPLIGHVLRALPDNITECIIVIGYLGELIKKHCKDSYDNIKLRYVEQEKSGTGGALLSARKLLAGEDRFFVVGSDDIFGAGELNKLTGRGLTFGIHFGFPNKPSEYGIAFDENNMFKGFSKLNYESEARYIGTGAYVLPQSIFETEMYQQKNGELSLPHTLSTLDLSIEIVMISNWLPVNSPAERKSALSRLNNGVQA